MAVDTCSGYNLIWRDNLPPDWCRYVLPKATLPRLAGANSDPLRLSAVVCLAVRLGNNLYRLLFVVAGSLAVDLILGTAFIDTHMKSIVLDTQRLEFRRRRQRIALAGSQDWSADGPEGDKPP